ncbi:MAG: MFS transporter [Acidimicrobiales bacterium]
MAGLVLTALMLGAVFDYGTTAISLLILPRPIAFAVGAWLAGSLVARFGGRAIVVLGCLAISGGLALIGVGAAATSVATVMAGVVVAGAGSGLVRPPIIAALTETVGDRDLGVGTGMLNMTSQIGAAAGISLLSGLVSRRRRPSGSSRSSGCRGRRRERRAHGRSRALSPGGRGRQPVVADFAVLGHRGPAALAGRVDR